MSFAQSIEAPLTLKDTMSMSGQLSTQNGTGSGSINVSAKRLISSKGWVEIDIGAGNGPTFSLKGFRTLTKRLFCDGATIVQFTSHGIKTGYIGSTSICKIMYHAVFHENIIFYFHIYIHSFDKSVFNLIHV